MGAAAGKGRNAGTGDDIARRDDAGAAAGAGSAKRYLQIADALKAALRAGEYPIGSQLPTEMTLCETYGVSRFTVREAIRVLLAGGLVHRRPRIGTIIAALPDEARYTQGLASVRDLQQYAEATTLDYLHVGRVGLSRPQARAFDAMPGDEWLFALAIRREPAAAARGSRAAVRGRPFGVTRLFVHPDFAAIESRLHAAQGAVYALIEREFGVRVQRVSQEIDAVLIEPTDAANLGVAAGSPGLRITRAYHDDAGRVVEFADNIHPAGAFTYRTQIER
ncbi:MAG: GntR family transcriptional regulator [Lautropia sp.]